MIFSFSLSSCQTESHQEQCRKLLEKASAETQKQDYGAAEKDFESAIKEAEQSDNKLQLPQVRTKYADLLIAEKKYPAAEESLNQALKLFSDALLVQKTDYDRAATSEDRVDALGKLAGVLTEQNKLGQAEVASKSAWDEARQIVGSLRVHNDLGPQYLAILKKEGKTDEAEEFETSSDVEFPEGNQHIVERRGYELMAQGNFLEAEKKFKVMRGLAKQRQTSEDYDSATNLIALCQYFSGDRKKCEKFARELIAAENKQTSNGQISAQRRARALTFLALALENSNEKESEADFAEAKQIDTLQSGLVLASVAKTYQAMAAYALPKIDQGSPVARVKAKTLVLEYSRQAERFYDRAFTLSGSIMKEKKPDAYKTNMTALAWTYAAQEKYTRAIQTYQEMFSLPGHYLSRGLHTSYIDLLCKTHNLSAARREMNEIVDFEQRSKEDRNVAQLSCMLQYVQHALTMKRTDDAQILAKIIIASPQASKLSPADQSWLRKLLPTSATSSSARRSLPTGVDKNH